MFSDTITQQFVIIITIIQCPRHHYPTDSGGEDKVPLVDILLSLQMSHRGISQ